MTEIQRQLLDELKQICTQYQSEVPTKRRPWPESIRRRILKLKRLGLPFHSIATETGIPAMILYSWGPDGKTRKRKKVKFQRKDLRHLERKMISRSTANDRILVSPSGLSKH